MLTPEQEDFIRERVYDAWRLGKYPEQTPMWHELDVKPTFVEASDIIRLVNQTLLEGSQRAWIAGGDSVFGAMQAEPDRYAAGFDAGVRAVYAAMPNMLDILREGPNP